MLYVKICGITEEEDAKIAFSYGADFIGLVLHPKSKRFLSPQKIPYFLKRFPFQNKVLVFAYDPIWYILEMAQEFFSKDPFLFLQLPIDHPYFSTLLSYVGKERIFPVIYVKEEKSLSLKRASFPLYILDHPPIKTSEGILYGGSGKRIPTKYIKNLPSFPFLLAGGIREENLEEILSLKPWGIDVSSGVEHSPGKKDPQKIRSLLKKVKCL